MARKAKKPTCTKRAPKKSTRHDWAPKLLAALCATGNISESCRCAGIGRVTFYHRRDTDRAFEEAARDAIEVATDALELEARRRAYTGTLKPVYGSGGTGVGTVKVGTIREYSDVLLIFLLKAHRPDKYRENVKHTHEVALPDEERVARIAAILDSCRTRRAGQAEAID